MIACSKRDDRLLAGLRLRRPFGQLDLDVMRIEELADAADHVDLARLGHAARVRR